MSEPPARVIGRASDYQQLLDLFRMRAIELNVSRDVLDEVSGLGVRYMTKLLGPAPVRKVGMNSLGPLLGALGARLALEVDPDAVARFCGRGGYGEREQKHVHSAVVHVEFSLRHMSRIGKNGGANSRKYVTADEASELGRRAALVRWGRVKAVAKGGR
jgi:hypothetical protein